MAFVFKFPDVGEGIHEGCIVEWLVAEGATVAEDEPLVKVETDKAVVDLPSPQAGTVLKLHAAAGATILVGDSLVSLGAPGEQLAAEAPIAAPVEAVVEVAATEAAASSQPAVVAKRPLATPRTRAMARRLGVDLELIRGSGRGGRITDGDVESAAQAPQSAVSKAPQTAAPPLTPTPVASSAGTVMESADGPVERVPLTHLRKVIANAMQVSKQTAAHVTHVDEADVTELMARYRQMKPEIEEQYGVRFTVLAFFIKALVATLKQFPMFNASIDEEAGEVVLKKYFNIGVAVDTPEGLIVPVLKNADQKDMVSIAAEVADLAERARERRLSLEELRGGTCTVTNIGPLGGIFATPIINLPELAIVGLHKIMERPAVVDGEIVIRQQMNLSVSFDHRYIDGGDAARFMSEMVRLVSSPDLLMARL